MRSLELPAGASPRTWGQIHGESFRGEVRALAAIRTYLCITNGRFGDRGAVLDAADAHLPVLAQYDQGLHDELCGIADGAGLTPAEIVIANHYTDLRDLDPDPARWESAPAGPDADPGGCSVVWSASPTGRILAQTWDMHATAIPYVMMLKVPDSAAGPAAWFLTLTGCLGLAGMNRARVAIAINNLYSNDATVGVVWPAMVRKALHHTTATAARDQVLTSPIGSGHHYFVADRAHAYGIETSGRLRRITYRGEQVSHCHTNHCKDAAVGAVSTVPATSSTYDRLGWLERSVATTPIADLADVWRRLGSQDGWPRSVCTNMATPESPHGTATCGAIAANLDTGELWAQGGFITNVAAERFALDGAP